MCHILYMQSDPQNPTPQSSPLLTDRTYDVLYCDRIGERISLDTCLNNLSAGDTLFIQRETELADELCDAVLILGNLARMGVDVWVERIKRLFPANNSPFLSTIGFQEAHALMDFHTTYVQQKLLEGKAKSTRKAGRPRIVLPEGFEEAKKNWLSGKVKSTEAATQCGMALATFRKWAKLLA